jgi:hypothetical protein
VNYNQLTTIRDLFKGALLDWDVPVEVNTTEDQTAIVSFTLWMHDFEVELQLTENGWRNYDEYLLWPATTELEVWRLIAANLSNRIP